MLEDEDEKILTLTESELLNVLEEQVLDLLRGYPEQILPVPEFLAAYMKYYGHSLRLANYSCSSVMELVGKIPRVAKVKSTASQISFLFLRGIL